MLIASFHCVPCTHIRYTSSHLFLARAQPIALPACSYARTHSTPACHTRTVCAKLHAYPIFTSRCSRILMACTLTHAAH